MKRILLAAAVLLVAASWWIVSTALNSPTNKIATTTPPKAKALRFTSATAPATTHQTTPAATRSALVDALPPYPNNWAGEHAPQLSLALDITAHGAQLTQATIIDSFVAPEEAVHGDDDFRVQLLDREQRVVVERGFRDPRVIHSPLQSADALASGAQAEPHQTIQRSHAALSLRLPHHPDAITLRVINQRDGKTVLNEVLGKTLKPAPTKTTTVYKVTKLQGRDDGVGTDFVFVGDGFLASEMSKFIDGVNAGRDRLLSWEPMNTYRDAINVFYIEVPSQESGVGLNGEASAKNTAFRSYFNCGNIDRLLCVGDDNNLRNIVQANVPQYDQVIVLANSTQYGGAGGWYSTASLAPSTGDLVTHEVGHSLTHLADEYDYGGSTAPISEPSEVNVTINNNSATVKWKHWMGKSGNFSGSNAKIGLFEGAKYVSKGVWRPTNVSMMRELGQPLYAVNAEVWALEFFRRAGAVAKLSPDNNAIAALSGQELTFKVIPGVAAKQIKTVWKVNGVTVNTNAAQFVCCREQTSNYVVSVEVSDDSGFIGKQENNLSSVSKTWNVTVSAVGGGFIHDFDHDGIADENDLDDDNDQMPDSWELLFGFNINNASDAALDIDGDSVSNINEYKNGSNPIGPDGGLTKVGSDKSKCLTVSNNALSSGDVNVSACENSPTQRWYISTEGQIKNELSATHCLDASTAIIALRTCDSQNIAQQFSLDDHYSLRVKTSGDAIDYGNNDVIRYAYHGGNNQQWPGIQSYLKAVDEGPDHDNDGTPDSIDNDDDNDSVEDNRDAFPLDATESSDNDSDGLGDNADNDDDNDGHNDINDEFPLDPTRWEKAVSHESTSSSGGGSTSVIFITMLMAITGYRQKTFKLPRKT